MKSGETVKYKVLETGTIKVDPNNAFKTEKGKEALRATRVLREVIQEKFQVNSKTE